MNEPGFGFWMNETSGRLERAIMALLEGDRLNEDEIVLIIRDRGAGG